MNNSFDVNKKSNLTLNVINLTMIFLPSIGYLFQAIKFHKTKSSKGFAKFLCLLLLLGNILRIFFWFGKRFETTLLYQAIVVIISQIYLIHTYLKYQEDPPLKDNTPLMSKLKNWTTTLNPFKIWKWKEEIEYLKFIIFLFVAFTIMCIIAGNDNERFFNIIGTLSVGCETFIEIPQIKENCATKNVSNLSSAMVFMWFLGDLFKTAYNIYYNSPMQMIIGGIIMNCEDIILSSQVLLYSESSILGNIFKRKYKYVSLDDEKKIEHSNKIDFNSNPGDIDV